LKKIKACLKELKEALKEDSGLTRGAVIRIQILTATGMSIGFVIGRWLR